MAYCADKKINQLYLLTLIINGFIMVLSKIFLTIVVKTTSIQSRLEKSNKMQQYADIY